MREAGQPFPCTCPCHHYSAESSPRLADGHYHPPNECPCAPFLDDSSIASIDVSEDPAATIRVFVTRRYPTRTV